MYKSRKQDRKTWKFVYKNRPTIYSFKICYTLLISIGVNSANLLKDKELTKPQS